MAVACHASPLNCARVPVEAFFTHDSDHAYSAMSPKRPGVEGELRREAVARAVGRDARDDRQEADLAARAVGRQGARLLAGGAGDAEAQALEGATSPRLKGERKRRPRHVLAVVEVEVDAAPVGGPVEDAGRVGDDARPRGRRGASRPTSRLGTSAVG